MYGIASVHHHRDVYLVGPYFRNSAYNAQVRAVSAAAKVPVWFRRSTIKIASTKTAKTYRFACNARPTDSPVSSAFRATPSAALSVRWPSAAYQTVRPAWELYAYSVS